MSIVLNERALHVLYDSWSVLWDEHANIGTFNMRLGIRRLVDPKLIKLVLSRNDDDDDDLLPVRA